MRWQFSPQKIGIIFGVPEKKIIITRHPCNRFKSEWSDEWFHIEPGVLETKVDGGALSWTELQISVVVASLENACLKHKIPSHTFRSQFQHGAGLTKSEIFRCDRH